MAQVIKFPAVNVREKGSSKDELHNKCRTTGAKILMFSGVRIERIDTDKKRKLLSDGYQY